MFKIKREKEIRACIIVFLLINYYFYFLFSMPHFINQLNSYNMKYGLAITSVILFSWFIIKNLFIVKATKPLFLISILYFIIFCSILYSLYKYGIYSYAMIGRAVYPFLICILFFPMYELFVKERYGKIAVQYLTILNIIADILLILQAILYYKYQLVFMHIPAYEMSGEVSIRDGNIRITYLDTMLLFSLFLSMDKIGNHMESRFDIWNVILTLCAIYFVSQTRSEILICLACLIICLIKRNGKLRLKNIIILASLFVILAFCVSYYYF